VLREFLSANRSAIIAKARATVAVRRAPRATDEEIETGIPLFLDQLIETLASSPGASDAIGKSASRHGGDMLQGGFTVAQVVHDYGGLCQAVTELAAETKAPITAEEFQIFNRSLDDAIAGAVTEYSRQREQTIADEGRERLGELAHELRNALGSAMISFDVLRTGNVGFGGSTAGVLAVSLGRLASLVNSSLAGVRLEAGLRSPERVSVREFMEELEVGASMEANAREVTLTVEAPERGVEVEADRALLAAAVSNLLHNAFKFGRSKGRVSLRTSSTEDRVVIEVEDECGGLPQGTAEVLFRPFAQSGVDRTGLGLGLSISRKSVEAAGGRLGVRDLPGKGCVFAIDLPRLPPAP
jgi:signal transduction histidine kinase